ncbi:DNA-binding CsgD family transcriptional regulator [Rhizobium sp. SG_E_25_P2]|uniref:helix-turn-helix transcriptional regulator n=1 Tax=Rhizobium sp. SG_E_25_P2 TaxID=2879942 RepID=UPI002476B357|nr:LuxR C-terminal-related transcriptional regulator [Rhizobium sp. SG_E_25_P2]MDH6268927.1 DNA-binding CsgD family transcriptional regulator [Rhizobium sp. SG_E_25_P2]
MDRWVEIHPSETNDPEGLLFGIDTHMTLKMRLFALTLEAHEPLEWSVEIVRGAGPFSSLLREADFPRNGPLRAFDDHVYLREYLVPSFEKSRNSRQPIIESSIAFLRGFRLSLDRIVMPQRSTGSPNWAVCLENVRSVRQPAPQVENLSVEESIISQMLREGLTAKEIAREMDVSHRTVEHRISQLKERYKARNVAHLTAILCQDVLD